MKSTHRIAIAGFGNVGQALARLIAGKNRAASHVVIVGVSDPRFGTVASGEGIEAGKLLRNVGDGSFAENPAHMPGAGVLEMVDAAEADTLVELSVTDLDTGEPATTHIRHAITAGLNVSTTNKGPIALHYRELCEMARLNGVALAFEGTVMSGTPVIELARLIRHAGFTALKGILNGTTNYIVTNVEKGLSYEAALAQAQSLGYAEADPRGDVDGYDSAAKLSILTEIFAGDAIPVARVERVSLSSITTEQIQTATAEGESFRYLSTLENHKGEWRARVAPHRLQADDPLTGVAGAGNGVTIDTELLGAVTLFGPGAGPTPTAFAVLSDLDRIERQSTG